MLIIVHRQNFAETKKPLSGLKMSKGNQNVFNVFFLFLFSSVTVYRYLHNGTKSKSDIG